MAAGEAPAAPTEAAAAPPQAPRARPPRTGRRPKPAAEEADGPLESGARHFPPPNLRDRLSPDLESEFDQALNGASLDELMRGEATLAADTVLEPESRHTGRVVAVRRDVVFLELGSREQGCVPVQHFAEPPAPGTAVEVIVQRFNAEDGLYDLMLPGTAADISDWEDLNEGMLVEAHVTGHNTGGLECEVNHIRGFIPVSQVAIYRVEDLAQFVGQHFTCLVTEANPMRRNLVLSRRAVLEQEKEEARKKFLESLAPGQIHEGVVRKIMDFGAFVDIGDVDGLLHVSQMDWVRVNHPSEVLSEGQKIRVKIEKVDPATGKIGFSRRDLLDNPWDGAGIKYPPNSIIRGKVTKLMEFGAFVELERGVEGLVHISELSPKRVWRTSDVVHEGEEVEVLVLSVDSEAQRISLSMKALAKPEPTKKDEAAEAEAATPAKPGKPRRQRSEPLRGGLGKSAGGESFGLKW
jgi:small subunit ribosomal protein S1